MTSKQEEIREGLLNLKSVYCHDCMLTRLCDESTQGSIVCSGNLDVILKYLDSQGVKIETKAWTSHGVVSTVYESLIKE